MISLDGNIILCILFFNKILDMNFICIQFNHDGQNTVYENIRRQIVEEKLYPGVVESAETLRTYSMSRTPIREILWNSRPTDF